MFHLKWLCQLVLMEGQVAVSRPQFHGTFQTHEVELIFRSDQRPLARRYPEGHHLSAGGTGTSACEAYDLKTKPEKSTFRCGTKFGVTSLSSFFFVIVSAVISVPLCEPTQSPEHKQHPNFAAAALTRFLKHAQMSCSRQSSSLSQIGLFHHKPHFKRVYPIRTECPVSVRVATLRARVSKARVHQHAALAPSRCF